MKRPPSQEDEEETPQGDEAPIVKYINKLLIDAIRMGASDLHFEPYEKSYRVRYRVDGVLRQIANPPLQLANRLASRLKSHVSNGYFRKTSASRWSYQA